MSCTFELLARVLLYGLLLFASPLGAQSDPVARTRVALVIGNGAYSTAPVLRNPGNDADGVAIALRRLGFDVTLAKDASLDTMRTAIQSFGAKAQAAAVSVVYYAGHAIQVDAQNYLLPTDTRIANAADIEFQTIALESITRTLSRASGAKVIILDACRNNPFRSTFSRGVTGARSLVLHEGLAKIEAGSDTYIVFSTAPDAVADDGQGVNSPFSGALIKYLAASEGDIQTLMRRVRREVIEQTRGTQTPWDQSSLTTDLFLAVSPQAPPAVSALATAGKGPVWKDLRMGQTLRDIKARYPKIEFEAEYEHGSEYSIQTSPESSVNITIDTSGSVRRMHGQFATSSRNELQLWINDVLKPIGKSFNDLQTSEFIQDPSLQIGEIALTGTLADWQKNKNLNLDYALHASASFNSPIIRGKSTFSLFVNEVSFERGRKLYDKFREHDIDTLHVAKVGLVTDGPYKEFHGLYSIYACNPPKTFFAEFSDRRNRWVFYSRGGEVFLRSSLGPPGQLHANRVVSRERRNRMIDGRSTELIELELADVSDPSNRSRVILAKAPSQVERRRFPDSNTDIEIPVGGLELLIGPPADRTSSETKLFKVRRCSDAFVHQNVIDSRP